MPSGKQIGQNIADCIKTNFRSATLNFLFILVYVNVFQALFGAENSIVGVSLVIIMMASVVRDMTGRPLKHLLLQALVLVGMGVSACLVHTLDPWAALPIHFATVFLLLYAFTYEYANHMYFPYILSYLFLLYISPVGPEGLPRRLAGLLAGAVSIILYQLFLGRHKARETALDVLTTLIGEVRSSIGCLLTGEGALADPAQIRGTLSRLSRTVYERRRKALCVSDAGFSMIDCGRGLEHMVLLLHELEGAPAAHAGLLRQVSAYLEVCGAYLRGERGDLPEPDRAALVPGGADALAADFYSALAYVRAHLLHMGDPDSRSRFRPTALSLSVRLRAALDVSAVRVVYALRVALLLSVFTLAGRLLGLPHVKWLLFTLASLSLPYADDVGAKTRKRVTATFLGGILAVAAYTLVPSPAGRTVIMMLSGYVSAYFSGYTGSYACSTVSALGGAVFLSGFTVAEVGGMFLVRVGYICLGALLAWLFNCVLLPFRRGRAAGLLAEKYASTADLLSRVCRDREADPQLYYSLVIQAHLLEDKLSREAAAGGWEDKITALLADCRRRVRQAHRSAGAGAKPAWE